MLARGSRTALPANQMCIIYSIPQYPIHNPAPTGDLIASSCPKITGSQNHNLSLIAKTSSREITSYRYSNGMLQLCLASQGSRMSKVASRRRLV
jgi:hypothetical protein